MRRVLLASLLLHAGLFAGLLLMPRPLPPIAEEPARMEVIFGANGATPTPQAPPPPPPPPVQTVGTGPAPPPPAAMPVAASADPGLRVDQPDPSLIPARDDPGNRAPEFPQGAWQRHEQGTVLLRLHISPDGTVARVEQLASSGYPALDDAAAASLAHWHFLPARQHGQPVASYRDQPVRFVIE
jgi:protein TonB